MCIPRDGLSEFTVKVHGTALNMMRCYVSRAVVDYIVGSRSIDKVNCVFA